MAMKEITKFMLLVQLALFGVIMVVLAFLQTFLPMINVQWSLGISSATIVCLNIVYQIKKYKRRRQG